MTEHASRWFLVSFDRDAGHASVVQYADEGAAFDAYIRAEQDPRTDGPFPQLDVVLIGGDSLEAVQSAYPHYFAKGSRRERMHAAIRRLEFA